MKNLESSLQTSIADYLKLKRVLFTASAGGMNASSVMQAVRNKKQGYSKGCPDIYIFHGNSKFHGLMLEIKNPNGKGKQSPEQKEWEANLTLKGYKYAIVDNFYKGVDIIDSYLALA